MNSKNINLVVQKVQSLPPLPAAVKKIYLMAEDPNTEIGEMARVIATDPSLTAHILRLTNSSFFGLSWRVSTVSQAITILGFRGVRNLALAMAVLRFPKAEDIRLPIDRKDFWRHSLAVATAAHLLATRIRLTDPEEAFVAGLLHDIGKLILMEHFDQQYASLVTKAGAGEQPLHRLEKEFFQVDHAQVGWMICQHWKIPSLLSRVVAEHHSAPPGNDIDPEQEKMIRAIKAADSLAKIAQIGFSGDSFIEVDCIKPLAAISIASENLFQILSALPEEVCKVEAFLELEQHSGNASRKEKLKSPAVGLSIVNPEIREIAAIALLSQGCTVVGQEQMDQGNGALCGIVVDDSFPPVKRLALKSKGVPILDVKHLLKGNRRLELTILYLKGLQDWLNKIKYGRAGGFFQKGGVSGPD